MGYELDADGLRRLGTFFSSIGDVLNGNITDDQIIQALVW